MIRTVRAVALVFIVSVVAVPIVIIGLGVHMGVIR